MENILMNKKSVKNNINLKKSQKQSKKYYDHHLFEKNPTKLVIGKLLGVNHIDMVDLTDFSIKEDYDYKMDKEAFLNKVQQLEIKGKSGDALPLIKKLEKVQDNFILLVNGVECDPTLLQDAYLYRNKQELINKTIKRLQELFHFSRSILATKEPVINSNTYEIFKVKDCYPMGYEKILIKTILNIDIARNEYPLDKNILQINLQTLLTLGSILFNSYAPSKYITVSNLKNGKGLVVRASLKTPLKTIVEKVSTILSYQQTDSFYAGGLMSCHLINLNEVLTDSINMITTCIPTDFTKAKNCIGCGKCEKVCPEHVNISKLVKTYQKEGEKGLINLKNESTLNCIGCGACSYVCAAGKDLRSYVAINKKSQI